MRSRRLPIVVAVVLIAGVLAGVVTVRARRDRPWNVVVILTDDQRWDSLGEMPWVHANLEPKAVNFTNAVMSTPLCCPARSSFLSGGFYASDTGVLNNAFPNGGASRFNDTNTLATKLQAKGYATGLVGKYLNEYAALYPRTPPGWTSFVNTDSPLPQDKGFSWFNYHVVRGSSTPTRAGVAAQREPSKIFMTDKITQEAVNFIDETPSKKPLFLMIDHVAPHEPAASPPEDASLYADYHYTGRAYAEADMSDKPPILRAEAANFDEQATRVANLPAAMLRSLRSVDRGVRDVVDMLRRSGRLDHTLLVFMSDNGFMWGEHNFFSKAVPYEESLRVPLLVVKPGVRPHVNNDQVAADLDVPATIARLAGVDVGSRGRDLAPLLQNKKVPWRSQLLIQDWAELSPALDITGWAGLRSDHYKYVEYDSGDRELYDLVSDPLEVTNIAEQPAMADRVREMSAALRSQMGLTIGGPRQLDAKVGKPYRFMLQPKGGRPPYQWSVTRGALPPGITVGADGAVTGVPTEAGTWQFNVKVTDETIIRQGRRPETYIRDIKVVVTR